jgi:3-oxoacyl-[acyl-carrier-protein] synthase-3
LDDRATCVLFGDGAGRPGATRPKRASAASLATKLHADGRHNELLFVDGGPSTTQTVGKLRMKGREVFRHAVVNLADVLNEVLADAGLEASEIDWVVPHQANARILDATARKLGLPPEKVVVTVDRHANTSAASVPLAWTPPSGWQDQTRRSHRAGGNGRRFHLGRRRAALLTDFMPRRIADRHVFG